MSSAATTVHNAALAIGQMVEGMLVQEGSSFAAGAVSAWASMALEDEVDQYGTSVAFSEASEAVEGAGMLSMLFGFTDPEGYSATVTNADLAALGAKLSSANKSATLKGRMAMLGPSPTAAQLAWAKEFPIEALPFGDALDPPTADTAPPAVREAYQQAYAEAVAAHRAAVTPPTYSTSSAPLVPWQYVAAAGAALVTANALRAY